MFPRIVKFKTEKEFKKFMKEQNPELDNPPMRCMNYYQLSCLIPEHCYNCAVRDGYPQYLGGDKRCGNYKVKDNGRKKRVTPKGKVLPIESYNEKESITLAKDGKRSGSSV